MATWKWGLVAIPAVSGIAIGAQKFSSQASEEFAPPTELQEFYDSLSEALDEDEDLGVNQYNQEAPSTDLYSQSNTQVAKDSQAVDSTFEKVKAESDSAFKKLDDYTFKLIAPCNVGTGWILDYQIPEREGDYPLVWYIATNAHVVGSWFFDRDTTYGQKLPRENKRPKDKTFGIESNYSLYTKDSCKLQSQGFFDINLAKWKDGKKKGSDKGAIAQNKMKAPRLFWSAINLFDVDHEMDIRNKNNFKDFVVMELEFTDEASAREITRDFADTYNVHSKDVINVFGDPLDVETTSNNEENFYTLGYPAYKNSIFRHSRSWDETTFVADRLAENNKVAFFNIDRTKNVNPKGYINTRLFTHIGFKWGKTKYQRSGHFYFMRGKVSGKGSSGSMYIDGKGNLLGVKSLIEKYRAEQNSYVTPLRSKRIVIEGNFKTPEYDLISGGPKHQRSSYKQQVENYLLNSGKKTWLSERAGWNKRSWGLINT